MSGYVHDGPHDRIDGRPLLLDGCPACEDHATKRGLGLDRDNFRAAWRLMIEVEYGHGGGYRSANERLLCISLYEMSLLLQRNFGLDPRVLVVV